MTTRPARPHLKLTEDGRRMREVLSYSRRGSRFTPTQQAAWDALNQNSPPSPASRPGGGGETRAPAWAQSMRAQQTARHHRQMAVHAVSQGDRGGGSATPDIKERND